MGGGTIYLVILSCFIVIINGSENRERDGKLFPVFQIIRYNNNLLVIKKINTISIIWMAYVYQIGEWYNSEDTKCR